MLTFQKNILYGGDATKAPFKTVMLAFHVPVFEFAALSAEASVPDAVGGGEILVARREALLNAGTIASRLMHAVRRQTGAIESNSVEQTLSANTYRIELDEAAIAGADDAARALAVQYYARALLEGNVDKLLATAAVQYLTDDGVEFGSATLDFICLLQAAVDSDSDATAVSAAKVAYLAVNKAAYSTLSQSLEGTSLKGDDSLVLQALSLVTARTSDGPTFRDDIGAEFERWLDRKTRGADAAAILDTLRKYFEPLYDFSLSIPEVKTVTIAGTVTMTAPTGVTVAPKDFLDLEISTVCSFENAPALSLVFAFSDPAEITGASAPFSLTGASRLLSNGMRGPLLVRVHVRSLGADVWSKEFARDDPKLAKLDIRIAKPNPLILSPAPKDAKEQAAKKLRGRVLTLNKDCALKDVLVLVQAKSATDAPWKVVGAATTDGLGNFSIPYPYGKYVQAQAMVSISPRETADIPTTGKDNESIADDFIYLLLTNPECPAPEDHEDCECNSEDKPKRLPDHSDLIGSDVYSQDIGGTCVNLSKPNRTISEFNYQAIVRASDPDVADYTLTKTETGLDVVDVSAAVALTNGAAELLNLTNTARDAAQQSLANEATAFAGVFVSVMENVFPHTAAIATGLAQPGRPVTATALATALHHLDAVIAILESFQTRTEVEDFPSFPYEAALVLGSANRLRPLLALAIDSLGSAARYELTGGAGLRHRQPVSLNNPIAWQDEPETQVASSAPSGLASTKVYLGSHLIQKMHGQLLSEVPPPNATFSQAVTVATGHILHYKAAFKSDGYSLGDLIYSLPLAPGQKKEIVVFEASQTLVGAESQSLAQNERLALGLINERDITNQLAGSITESMRGSSSANTSGISAGFGTGGQGYGGTGAYGGSGSAVIGIAGGAANANSIANQDSSRDVSQFFGEKLRQSIMQNAEGYRQLNASVVTTLQEGQRYGVTSEVVANHNHCHSLTMMYFEVLRHYAIFQELSSAEECVFVPLLLTKFSTENVERWRDVLAPALLPIPSETYLKTPEAANGTREHQLLKAFDANCRIRTNYANVDMPAGSYDDERIQFARGSMRLRVSLPRPRTRFDRIMSLPITTQTITSREIDPEATAAAALEFPRKMAEYATKTAVTAGLNNLFGDRPPDPPGLQYKTTEKEILVREAIFDAFMKLDANFESVPPAQCIRITTFSPPPKISIGPFGQLTVLTTDPEVFFAGNIEDQQQWQAYATLLGYPNVLTMLNAHFRGNLISEWDSIFNTDIAPLAFEKIMAALTLDEFAVDFASEAKYRGGERMLRVNLAGTTSKKRNQLPQVLRLEFASNTAIQALKQFITLDVQDLTITYSTSHYNGTLYSGTVGDDLLDGTNLFIPENSEEKRNPRREDRYLAAKLVEHLNSNLEFYNKVLWYNLDPDRRYMLLDGFTIQIYDEDGTLIATPDGLRSLASVVKNDVIAVAGNSLVMPVAPGYRVSGSFIRPKGDGVEETVTLFDHYKPLTPVEPYRISVPSKGVFCEAVQGVCNACEKIETDRLQDWNRFPNTDEPTAISPITAPTPAPIDWQAAFKDFATPIVNIQNAPALPAPGEGMQGLGDLLGKAGVFKDITGLDANQQNVIRTYLSNQENAKAFAEMAKEMAMQQHNTQNAGKIMDSITAAKNSGAISQSDAGQLVKDHLQQQIDGGASEKAKTEADGQAAATPLSQAAVNAASQGKDVTASRLDSAGNSESVSIHGPESSKVIAEAPGKVPHIGRDLQKKNDCWAVVTAMMIGWSTKQQAITAAEAVTPAGQKYLKIYTDDTGLLAEDKDDFILRSRMFAEPPANYRLDQYVDWVKTYGPLWVTLDTNPGQQYSPHAWVLIRISGTGTPDGAGTYFTFIDPSTGTEVTQPFAEFIRRYEEQPADVPQQQRLSPQVVHFIDPIVKPEGYQIEGPFNIHEPIHEKITLAALLGSTVSVPAGVSVGSDQATNEFLRGVIWNDDPAVLMFDEDTTDNWHFSTGVSWYFAFKLAGLATMNNLTNLTGRSHYFDLQFLHAMASTAGELPTDTLAKIMLWAEVMYRLSIGDGVSGTDKLGSIAIASNVTAAGATYSYSLSQFFDAYTVPRGDDTLNHLLTLDTACVSLDLKRRAIGSLLHLVQDSYARGHVRRTLTNPGDLLPGKTDEFKPGTYGHYGEVENFHCYRGQSELHDKYDKPPLLAWLRPNDINSFNVLHGARDATDASRSLLSMWNSGTPWEAPGGPKELLEGTVFKLAAKASPADATV